MEPRYTEWPKNWQNIFTLNEASLYIFWGFFSTYFTITGAKNIAVILRTCCWPPSVKGGLGTLLCKDLLNCGSTVIDPVGFDF